MGQAVIRICYVRKEESSTGELHGEEKERDTPQGYE